MKSVEIKTLNNEDFEKYGCIIEITRYDGSGRHFEVLVDAHSSGWRIGVMDFEKNVAPYLERHLKSKESYEPVFGTIVLLVAQADVPEVVEVFLLDKPVCINECIWHQVMAISDIARVKVTENICMPSSESETFAFVNSLSTNVLL